MSRAAVKRLSALLLSLALLLALVPFALAENEIEHFGEKSVKVYIDSLLRLRGYRFGRYVYLPAERFLGILGVEAELSRSDDAISLIGDGLHFECTLEEEYGVCNYRYVYIPNGVQELHGTLYLPLCTLAQIFSLDTVEEEERAEVSTEGLSILQGYEGYYNYYAHGKDFYWLSRIINAEGSHQPLSGKIAVGNVVMNRVASPLFPDNVYDVVFDTVGTVQFTSTVENDGIDMEPYRDAIIAGLLVYEGVNVVEDCLYFVDPLLCDASWFEQDLIFFVTIGDHFFYKEKEEPQDAA